MVVLLISEIIQASVAVSMVTSTNSMETMLLSRAMTCTSETHAVTVLAQRTREVEEVEGECSRNTNKDLQCRLRQTSSVIRSNSINRTNISSNSSNSKETNSTLSSRARDSSSTTISRCNTSPFSSLKNFASSS